MTTTFSPAIPPQTQPAGAFKFVVLKAKFGDGYGQAVGDGINARQQKWPLTFVGTEAEVGPIQVFLDARGGYESFYWTPPGPNAVLGLYRCDEYQCIPHVGAQLKLTCTLEEWFQP